MKKRMLSAVLASLMALSMGATALAADEEMDISTRPMQTAPVSSGTLVDVKDSDWFKDAAYYVVNYKLMDPIAKTTDHGAVDSFEPNSKISREEVAEAIYRDAAARQVASIDGDAGMAIREMVDYNEVNPTMMPGVSFCFDTGIMGGNEKHELQPGKHITRQELCAVLERYYKYLVKTDSTVDDGVAIKEFTDYATIGDWARQHVSFCVKTGMMKGKDHQTKGMTFEPRGTVSRAEIAQILYNLEQGFVAKPVSGLKLISK